MSNQNKKPASSVSPAKSVVLLGNRSREIPLEYPAEFDGMTYDKVTIRRMTPLEVEAFARRAAATKPGDDGDDLVPVEMLDIPKEVFLGLDPDDRETVEEAIYDFLPRRLQMALALSQETGEATSPSSQASSEVVSNSTSA